jgi:hypothetical protein
MLAPCSTCRRLAHDSGPCPFCGGALEAPLSRPPRGRYARNAMLVAVATAALACGGTSAPETKDAGADGSTGSDGSASDASSSSDTSTGFDATPIIVAFIPDDSGPQPLYGGSPSP